MTVPIINQPSRIVTHLAPEAGLYEPVYAEDRKLRLRALACPVSRALCASMDVALCEVFPDWLIESGPGLIKHTRIRAMLQANPFISVQMLLSAYDETHAMIEKTVMESAESVVPLLEAIDAGKIIPTNSRDKYEQRLLKSPWWGLRYLSLGAPSEEIAYRRKVFSGMLRKQCETRAGDDPESALVHLLLNSDKDPSQFAKVLVRDPMTAYLSTRLLGIRGLNLRIEDVPNLDPRWATHIALWGAFRNGNMDDRVEDAIAEHGAWAGEYIVRNDAHRSDWPWIQTIYSKFEGAFQKRKDSSPYNIWGELLWALLDRIALETEGKNPRVTLGVSMDRQASQAKKKPDSTPAAPQN